MEGFDSDDRNIPFGKFKPGDQNGLRSQSNFDKGPKPKSLEMKWRAVFKKLKRAKMSFIKANEFLKEPNSAILELT